MNTSSVNQSKLISPISSSLDLILPQLPNYPFTEVERINGGKNSQVYRLTSHTRAQFALKIYFQHKAEQRNRLKTEFLSLKFLKDQGIKAVPKPYLKNESQGWSLYEYISGEPIRDFQVTSQDITTLVDFLLQLKNLSKHPASHDLNLASEAQLSIQGIIDNIKNRLNKLLEIPKDTIENKLLNQFLQDDLVPFLSELIVWCQPCLKEKLMDFSNEIVLEQRTLSPSDYGFHNALRQDNGELVFLDFEYFGWDDPAKMISDFLLHPARMIDFSLKQQFFSEILAGFSENKTLSTRVKIVYPLFGIKWCLILLNEFIPEQLLRRGFADINPIDKRERQAQQLAKAKQMLTQIKGDYEQFPYYY
ncbi:phosphotransferase (plasmid) [Crocosphaera watsonii WH 8501]|uniref:Aminoglycoside phosphotransferase domain-containing protein n=1 Tax=Crocosphaera watsonii WH 8502 TaxID=423474 RepID=T2IA98_CROWT|nr:aminoglycoside phosphotransferase family protein [Crocosphaera watsonii]CCQ50023.1 hypothetical protein CWATWH8502_1811 [Crocosphaera watsonii WH 8502]